MAAVGRTLMLVPILGTPMLPSGMEIGWGAIRRPLSSTRVLPEPSPRRPTVAMSPRASAPEAWLSLIGTRPACGMLANNSAGVVTPRVLMSSSVTTVTGRAFSCSRRAINEPVTANASSLTVSSGFAAGAWARTGTAAQAETRARTMLERGVFMGNGGRTDTRQSRAIAKGQPTRGEGTQAKQARSRRTRDSRTPQSPTATLVRRGSA